MSQTGSRLAVDLQKTAQWGAHLLYAGLIGWTALGYYVHPGFYVAAGITLPFALLNIHFKHIQKKHTLLRNFGLLGAARYMMESVGPELRQYFFSSDTEERPFNRMERAEVYRKAKNIDSTEAFGSLLEFNHHEVKLKHSMFPVAKKDVEPFSVTFGERSKNPFSINKHIMISAMSFGSLGAKAVEALSTGAKKAGIPMNTGEGGLSKYHLKGGADIIFQMGTAKFGVRNDDGTLNDDKLRRVAGQQNVRMIEIKFSQGAKPGKGGILPKSKITKEIAQIRGVSMDKDIISPERHQECDTPENTVKFIRHVQDVSELPVGIKLCLGDEKEFRTLVEEMKKQDGFPDYIAVDGSEGATGAAPKSFMDNVGVPLLPALQMVVRTLEEVGVRSKVKIVASGKLINPGKQITAIAHGADACYSARGFMLALGCIQALQCNKGGCPVGITTHDPILQRGLIVREKATRVANYVKNLDHEMKQLLAAMGLKSVSKLNKEKIYVAPKELIH
jgi:glutamate synthase domain-containing protein 2